MTATAPPPDAGRRRGIGFAPSVLRTKRTIALLRICVLAVVTVLYLSSVGVRRVAGPGALLLLIGAFVYALVCLVLSTRGEESSVWGRVVTLAIDVALITAWIDVDGRRSQRVLDPVPDRHRGGRVAVRHHRDRRRGRRARRPADGAPGGERRPVDVEAVPADPAAGRGVRDRGAVVAARGSAAEAVRDGGDRRVPGATARQGARGGGAAAQGRPGADRVRRGRGARAPHAARRDPRAS